eukprot:402571_1
MSNNNSAKRGTKRDATDLLSTNNQNNDIINPRSSKRSRTTNEVNNQTNNISNNIDVQMPPNATNANIKKSYKPETNDSDHDNSEQDTDSSDNSESEQHYDNTAQHILRRRNIEIYHNEYPNANIYSSTNTNKNPNNIQNNVTPIYTHTPLQPQIVYVPVPSVPPVTSGHVFHQQAQQLSENNSSYSHSHSHENQSQLSQTDDKLLYYIDQYKLRILFLFALFLSTECCRSIVYYQITNQLLNLVRTVQSIKVLRSEKVFMYSAQWIEGLLLSIDEYIQVNTNNYCYNTAEVATLIIFMILGTIHLFYGQELVSFTTFMYAFVQCYLLSYYGYFIWLNDMHYVLRVFVSMTCGFMSGCYTLLMFYVWKKISVFVGSVCVGLVGAGICGILLEYMFHYSCTKNSDIACITSQLSELMIEPQQFIFICCVITFVLVVKLVSYAIEFWLHITGIIFHSKLGAIMLTWSLTNFVGKYMYIDDVQTVSALISVSTQSSISHSVGTFISIAIALFVIGFVYQSKLYILFTEMGSKRNYTDMNNVNSSRNENSYCFMFAVISAIILCYVAASFGITPDYIQ